MNIDLIAVLKLKIYLLESLYSLLFKLYLPLFQTSDEKLNIEIVS